MADLTIEVTFLCGHTKQISGDRYIEVLEEIPYQPDPNRLNLPYFQKSSPNTGNAGPITNQATTPATVPSAAITSLGPVAILPYPKPGARTSQKPALNKRARALSNPKRNDANRVTKPSHGCKCATQQKRADLEQKRADLEFTNYRELLIKCTTLSQVRSRKYRGGWAQFWLAAYALSSSKGTISSQAWDF
ncbi:hypothetical protein F4821DRAFT_261954 [Hypoxylon rubiginosum]|uniref:Uncharacterized protein n=1 Tax=Hypoxylon rubiginosum TaxID=110542 RepID=A0ACC0CVK9_9PEZI|nr:hypothetical protein F4821DRAFT_261954 [Hypoxylon rubiginosum]